MCINQKGEENVFVGPNILVDKSTIQGLNGDEIEILHRYYRVVISPILIRELTSFLAKVDFGKEDLQHRLQILAKKSDSIEAAFTEDEKTVIYNEVIGIPAPMNGFSLPRTGGKIVEDEDGAKGVFFDEHEDRKILRNWADGIFTTSDFTTAVEIRSFDLDTELKRWQKLVEENKRKIIKFKKIDEVVAWVDKTFLPAADENNMLLEFILKYLGLDVETNLKMIENWKRNNRTTLYNSAPYSYMFCRIVYVFYFLNLSGVIQTNKNNKNHIDICYLYYLPFVSVFTSGDGFFKRISPFFLRDDQVFVDTKDLKQDLKNIIDFFNKQNEEEKKRFNGEYGIYPPSIEGSITADLWKKHTKPKPPMAGIQPERSEEELNKFKSKFKSNIDKSK